MSIKQYHISLEAFLEKHSFSFVKKSRDSLGSYTVIANNLAEAKYILFSKCDWLTLEMISTIN